MTQPRSHNPQHTNTRAYTSDWSPAPAPWWHPVCVITPQIFTQVSHPRTHHTRGWEVMPTFNFQVLHIKYQCFSKSPQCISIGECVWQPQHGGSEADRGGVSLKKLSSFPAPLLSPVCRLPVSLTSDHKCSALCSDIGPRVSDEWGYFCPSLAF